MTEFEIYLGIKNTKTGEEHWINPIEGKSEKEIPDAVMWKMLECIEGIVRFTCKRTVDSNVWNSDV